jgi:hypothetical protein
MKNLNVLSILSIIISIIISACTGTPTVDLEATVQAAIAATQAAQPTEPTVDLEATVQAAIAATQAAQPTVTPEPTTTPTEVPSPTPLRPTDTPVPPTPIPILSGVYTTDSSKLSFSKIYFKEEKPDFGIYHPNELLGTVDFIVLQISNSSNIKIKFSDIKSIEFGPNPEDVIMGSGWGVVTLRNGEQISGAFTGAGGGDIGIYILVGNSEVKIELLRFEMEKSRIDFD